MKCNPKAIDKLVNMMVEFEATNNMQSTRQYIMNQQSENDKQLSKFYHNIDTKKSLDMYKGYLVYKELQNILQQRVKIKKAMSIFKIPKG
jgi:hypothetical protein